MRYSPIPKLAFACFLAASLSGCEQKLSSTLYVRDIQEMAAAAETESIPVEVRIEVLETGIDQKCSTPEGQQIVESVASVFRSAELAGCEKIAGSMNDRMVIKAGTVMRPMQGDGGDPGEYLVHFEVFNDPNASEMTRVVARFNFEKYEALLAQVSRINSMMSMSLDEARMAVVINNDLRDAATFELDEGVFADGAPIDIKRNVTLEPRQEIAMAFGDVKTAFLGTNGWAFVATMIGDSAATE